MLSDFVFLFFKILGKILFNIKKKKNNCLKWNISDCKI